VRATESLDLNSPYAYLLLCSDFADTSLVAERDGELVGFVGAYRPPARREAIFVWQILVAETGRGIGTQMLAALLELKGCAGVRYLEATVTPSNAPSRALFTRFARERGVGCREQVAFSADLFPGDHESEVRLITGPFPGRRGGEIKES
jgi:L-2,4-diaminobutyric acid acetyltransferase